jgi:hypothetical protein
VIVHVDVLADTRRVDPDNPPIAPAGLPIAHLVNMDTRDNEGYFDLKPRTVADYYVWVDDNGRKKSRYTLLELVGNTVTATKQWNVRACHARASGDPSPRSDFDFYEYKHGMYGCSRYDDDAYANGRVGSASLLSVVLFRQLFTRISAMIIGETALQGSWIECSSGCCT